ncbi:MAG TPA: type II toxin-antitoxin system VapC family toxin [Methylibium sp.]|nr:type II toxin-antitoxin system VapC family toxin [Methylibium sp.]
MSALVLDASAALAWCFADERTAASQALLDQVAQVGAVVPPLWHLEVGNILLAAERRARATVAQVADAIGSLARLPIATDQADAAQRTREALALARQHRLSVYDACYLDLALRRALPLATLDPDLQRAARETGVALIEL